MVISLAVLLTVVNELLIIPSADATVLPALSINYGDVGVSVGKEFHVRDYDNMFDKVMAMVNDPLLFKRAIKMAKERGKLLTDTARPFINAMHMIERREAFE